MRIEIHTANASTLWSKIKKDIVDENIKTWSIIQNNKNQDFLTHKPAQWYKKALLEPSTATNPTRLILTVNWFTNDVPNEYTKGLYVGRFTEELLEHYRASFSKLETFA